MSKTTTRRAVMALALGLLLIAPASAQNGEEKQLRFAFKNADLDLVLSSLAKSLGVTFIKETTVEGKLTAVSDRPIPKDRAIAFLNSALIRYNVAAVPIGDVVKIVTLDDAKRLNHAIFYGSDPEALRLGDNIRSQIIPLQFLEANQIKKELSELTSKTGQMLLNSKANVIVLTDTESNIKRFLTIIKQIDKAVVDVLKVKLYRLKYASAEDLGKAVDELFQPFEKKAASSGGGMREMMMRRFMGGGRGGRGGGGNAAESADTRSQLVRTTVEQRTNTLIVTANESTLKQIDSLVEQLDQPISELLVIRIYPLEHAEAANVTAIVKEIVDPGSGGNTGKQQQQAGGRMGRWMRMMQAANQPKTSQGPQTTIKISADERTNSVVVAASEDNQALIRTVVTGLDRKVEPDQQVRIFTLKNADAEELKTTLEEVFDLQQQGRSGNANRRNTNPRGNTNRRNNNNRGNQRGGTQRGGNQRGGNQRGGGGGGRRGGPGDAPGAGAGGNAGVQPKPAAPVQLGVEPTDEVKVSIDRRTNSIIITATKEDFDAVSRLIQQLDQDNADLESTLVVRLQNGNAENMEGLLNDLFSDNANRAGGGRRNQGPSLNAQVGGLTGQVRVRGDAESNSLVFVTASRNFETIKRLVAELDRERPQVLIKAFIVEVDLDGSTELGVEWTYTNNEGRETVTNDDGTTTSTERRTSSTSTDFDVGAAPGGFRYSFAQSDFEVLMRALRRDGKLNVVSAPRILVQDNEEAEINLGQEVPYVTNSRLTDQGTTLNTIQYRDVGIILTVTPTINPKGLVKMVVSPEVSEIAPDSQSVQITEGVRSPVFLRNFANTTITVKDGQTIVMGGLIQDRTRESASKVPILGDIPLLGMAFRSTTTETRKVELMIFITPYVVNFADELDELTTQEIANLRLIEARSVRHQATRRRPMNLLSD